MEEIVALDIETTGLDPQKDRVIEIALIRIKDGNIIEKFVTLVNPEVEVPPSVSEVHGITDDMLKDAPFFRDIAARVIDFIKDSIILAHNAGFDISFLREELKRCGMEFPPYKEVIDTLLKARAIGIYGSNSLSSIAEYYGKDISSLHRAEPDALMAYEIYCRMEEEK